ncbi:MAG: hypothetical protein U9Q40_00180 [Campylobacterota bacterium]|nr:hypothetical protein [Campylobacterota bacterium]
MEVVREEKNRDEITLFLNNNGINPEHAMGFENKFATSYYVGESRKFAEETTIGFNIAGESDVNVTFFDINSIEFETEFKMSEQLFSYDESNETLTITGTVSQKHNQEYKIVINSIFLDL